MWRASGESWLRLNLVEVHSLTSNHLDDLRSSTKISLAAVLGVMAGVTASFFTLARSPALIGWDVAGASLLVRGWPFGIRPRIHTALSHTTRPE